MKENVGGEKQDEKNNILKLKRGGKERIEKPLFFLYHKIRDNGDNEYFGCVYGDTFESQLIVIFLKSFLGEIFIGLIIISALTFLTINVSYLLKMSLFELVRCVIFIAFTFVFMKQINKGGENGEIEIRN
jgi:hypothetical protein